MHSDSVYIVQNSLATLEKQDVPDVAEKVRAPTKHGGEGTLLKNLLLIIIHKNM